MGQAPAGVRATLRIATNRRVGDRSSNWPVSSRVARALRLLFTPFTLLLAVACSKPAPPESSASATTSAVRGGALTVSLRSEPNTFNRLSPAAAQAAVDAFTRLMHA